MGLPVLLDLFILYQLLTRKILQTNRFQVSQNAGIATTARSMAVGGSEVLKILEERILGQESSIKLEETGKVGIAIDSFSFRYFANVF